MAAHQRWLLIMDNVTDPDADWRRGIFVTASAWHGHLGW
jgi:hypothetical protein